MTARFTLRNVTKRFDKQMALDSVTLTVDGKSIIGLVGKNGSGKTTLLRHITGLYLPTTGESETFGVPTNRLGANELSRIGTVQQKDTFLDWMRIRQLVSYVSHFYARWDRDLEHHLLEVLELDETQRVGTLSPGNKQKLALIIGTCHHPDLLLLDEPLSDLDPIARRTVLASILDQFARDDVTIVISSHMLHEIERIADRIVVLDKGRLLLDTQLDDLKEQYEELVITSPEGKLPIKFSDDSVIFSEGDRFRAHLIVRAASGAVAEMAQAYSARVESNSLNLDRLFELIAQGTISLPAMKAEEVASIGGVT